VNNCEIFKTFKEVFLESTELAEKPTLSTQELKTLLVL
jgi:hypothetical protein